LQIQTGEKEERERKGERGNTTVRCPSIKHNRSGLRNFPGKPIIFFDISNKAVTESALASLCDNNFTRSDNYKMKVKN
jgi:hypothetical protein